MHYGVLIINFNASEFRNFLFPVMFVPLSAVNVAWQTDRENVKLISDKHELKR